MTRSATRDIRYREQRDQALSRCARLEDELAAVQEAVITLAAFAVAAGADSGLDLVPHPLRGQVRERIAAAAAAEARHAGRRHLHAL
jgi:hypothetical protein